MVALVDVTDRVIGTAPKLEAHQKGLLHRAFSVFIFNSKGELLLHRRHPAKYHGGGLWTNTCCSHPRAGEPVETEAALRLQFEMGLSAPLQYCGSFIYRAGMDNGLTEHELDHLFVGISDEVPDFHPEEVSAYRYASVEEIRQHIQQEPGAYSPWFRIIMEYHRDQILSTLQTIRL